MGNGEKTAETNLEANFVILVYPFQHALVGKGRNRRLNALESRWAHWLSRLETNDDYYHAIGQSDFFLPHMRRFLFPMLDSTSATSGDRGIEAVREWSGRPAGDLMDERNVDIHQMLRLTLKPGVLEKVSDCVLEKVGGKWGKPYAYRHGFRTHWIDVALFPNDVGFLIFRLELLPREGDNTKLDDLIWFLMNIRYVIPPLSSQRNFLRLRFEDGEKKLVAQDLVDYLLQGMTMVSHGLEVSLNDIDSIQDEGNQTEWRYTATPRGSTYGRAFRRYVFARVAEPLDTARSAGRSEIAESGMGETPHRDLFDSPEQLMLYEISHCVDSSRAMDMPHPIHLQKLMDEGLIAVWKGWQALVLSDSVSYLGQPARSRFMEMPMYFAETSYFMMYLLSCYQKLRLSFLYEDLVRPEERRESTRKKTGELWDDFLMFRNRHWFREVTYHPQGQYIFERFREANDVVPLFEEIENELSELDEYLQSQAERNLNIILGFLTFLVAPLGIIATLIGSLFILDTSWRVSLWQLGVFILLPYLVLFASAFAVKHFRGRRKRARR